MVTITLPAQLQISRSIQCRGSGLGIRIGIKTAGCSGFAYVIEYVDQQESDDILYQYDEFVLVINKKHVPILDNITIDYVKKGLNQGFEFINPLETARCGCGESFQI